jgi:hypothetical protein
MSSTVKDLAGRILLMEHGYDLEALLKSWQQDGCSLRQMSAEMERRYGISVTHQTIKSWLGYPG